MSKQLDSILRKATTTTPKPAATQDPVGTVVPLAVPEPPAAPAPEAAKPADKPVQEVPEKPKEAQKAIQAFVPASVARSLNIRAAEEGVTVRTIILQGLKSIGLDVPEHELRDRRK